MHSKTFTGAIGVAIGTAAFAIMTGQPVSASQAQSPASPAGQTAAPSTTQSGRTTGDQSQVTMTGCIQREADYRRATSAGGGGLANTGAGLGNEFILVNAMMSTGSSASASAAPATGATPRGTTGTAGAGTTAAGGGSTTGGASSTAAGGAGSTTAGAGTSATGAASGAAGAASTAAGAGSGTAYELTGSGEGAAASLIGKRVEVTGTLKPAAAGGPTANAPGSQDLQLREFEVASVRETTGTCAPAASTPAR